MSYNSKIHFIPPMPKREMKMAIVLWICYYADGKLAIDEEKADNVLLIFDLYLHGQSVLAIIRELEKQRIKSPTGKDKWCNRSIETI